MQKDINELRDDISRSTSSNLKKQLKSRIQAFQRLQGLYYPTNKRVRVKGIRVTDENGNQKILCQPEDMQAALASYWGEVYSLKEGDEDAMRKFLTYYIREQGHLFNFEDVGIPEEEDYIMVIQKSKDSACGPDGIPYCAYRATKELSARILAITGRELAQEAPRSDLAKLNCQFIWFPPKGPAEVDESACISTCDKLRTVFGGNADSKLIAGAQSYKLVQPTLDVTPLSQRGFSRGGQLCPNIVDLDMWMRAFKKKLNANLHKGDIGEYPATALYDFSSSSFSPALPPRVPCKV